MYSLIEMPLFQNINNQQKGGVHSINLITKCPLESNYSCFYEYQDGATSGAGTINSLFCVAQSLVFCVVFCRPLFVFLSFFCRPLFCLSFIDASAYPFGIYKRLY